MSGLLELLLTPLGILAVLGAFAFFAAALSQPVFRWVGVGAAMYAASLQKFVDPFQEEEWFSHWGVIETLVKNGRFLTIGLLIALLAVTFPGATPPRRQILQPPRLMWPIHAIQILLLVKMLTGNVSVAFIVQAAIVYALVAALGVFSIRGWLSMEKNLSGPAIALTTALVLFCAVVEFELRVLPDAVMLTNGRLIGTCANPQHAAVLLAACLPGPLYLLVRRESPRWLRIASGLLMIPTAHLLFLTGSRTGAAMALIALVLFFRRRLVPAAIAATAVYVAYVWLLDPGEQENAARLTSLEDTRSHVWEAQWRGFLAHPLFGTPVEGDRLGFGENSWLALLQSTGIVGGALLVWLLVRILKLGAELFRLEQRAGRPLPHVDFCLAGLAALFAGSFLEAYLLGIITLPILAILTYSAASDRILEKAAGKRKILPGKRRRDLAMLRKIRSSQGLRIEGAP